MVLWSLLLTKGHIYSSCGCLELDRTSTQVFSLCGSALNTQRNETVLTLVGPLTSASPNTAVLANPLLPPYSPPPLLFFFPCDPSDLCTVTAQREDPVLRLPWQWPWRASVRHSGPQTHSLTHCGKAGDRYSITRKRGWGWVGRRELHCSELTAEAQGKLVREECVCQSVTANVCVWLSTGHHISLWTVVSESFCACFHSGTS